MVEVLIAEPGEVSEAQLDAAEALVRSAFGSSFRSHDRLPRIGVPPGHIAPLLLRPHRSRYTNLFDTAEVLIYLICADQIADGTSYVDTHSLGLFATTAAESYPFEGTDVAQILTSATDAVSQWPPVQVGLFQGSGERLQRPCGPSGMPLPSSAVLARIDLLAAYIEPKSLERCINGS